MTQQPQRRKRSTASSEAPPNKPALLDGWEKHRSRDQDQATSIEWRTEAQQVQEPPTIDPVAFYGVLGQLANIMAKYTGLDVVTLYGMLLLYVGNALGPDVATRLDAGPRQRGHMAMTFIGETGSGKDRCNEAVRDHVMLGIIDGKPVSGLKSMGWGRSNLRYNLRSGEAVVRHVRDPKKDEEARDTRILIVEREYTRLLKDMNKRDSTLSEIFRQSCDGPTLGNTTKTESLNDEASRAHVSWLGLSTEVGMQQHLRDIALSDGMANRATYFIVAPSSPPARINLRQYEQEMTEPLRELHAAIRFAQSMKPLSLRVADALRRLEEGVKQYLVPLGLVGAQEARFLQHVMRYALILAATDRAPKIDERHLVSAMALRHHSTKVNIRLFGERTGSTTADEVLRALVIHDGAMSLTDLHRYFFNNLGGSAIRASLHLLVARGLVEAGTSKTKGRPGEHFRLREKGSFFVQAGLSSFASSSDSVLTHLLHPTERAAVSRIENREGGISLTSLLSGKDKEYEEPEAKVVTPGFDHEEYEESTNATKKVMPATVTPIRRRRG